MSETNEIQWLFLDLLMRARDKGVTRVNRHELLSSPLPDGVKIKLVFQGLTMANGGLVRMHGPDDFEITEKGVEVFTKKFRKPTPVADAVIALPDQSSTTVQ